MLGQCLEGRGCLVSAFRWTRGLSIIGFIRENHCCWLCCDPFVRYAGTSDLPSQTGESDCGIADFVRGPITALAVSVSPGRSDGHFKNI